MCGTYTNSVRDDCTNLSLLNLMVTGSARTSRKHPGGVLDYVIAINADLDEFDKAGALLYYRLNVMQLQDLGPNFLPLSLSTL